jgi:hypothetical protein
LAEEELLELFQVLENGALDNSPETQMRTEGLNNDHLQAVVK